MKSSCWSLRPCQVSRLTFDHVSHPGNICINTVCAGLPSGTKTLVVHGQNECDIPTQLPVHEDTQFDALLKVNDKRLFYSCS